MNRPEQASGLVWLLIGISISAYTLLSLRIGSFREPGPGFFPLVAGIALTGLASLQLLRTALKKTAEKRTIAELWQGSDWRKVCYIMAALVICYIVFKTIGFLLSTACLMIFLLTVIGGKTWKYAIGAAVLMSACSYALFYYLLQVELPVGILGF
jgi:putative tricarboxylic transport membrane protein